jgi:serine/threonine protein kinase/tetratricopeptide (TPR) repeat protein
MDSLEQRALTIARDALDVDDAAERRAFVEAHCNDVPGLAERVLRLLEATIDEDVAAPLGMPSSDEAFAPGAAFGPYRLIRPIGRGGMGVVWLAERADGVFERSVALKLLLGGWLRPDEHFRRERDILARLNHPNIAQLFDGGATDRQPWFALEYVDGEQIIAFADARHLDARARVRLFLPICSAVQFAHQHLVVHRDIKPANVLVSADGTPKLLDFGIAKLIGDADARQTQTFAMTPAYASPEQRRGEPVGTAGDVYQLGLLLYELLLGRSAHDSRIARGGDVVPRLDLAFTRLDLESRHLIAKDRGVSAERLRGLLRGDLARIVDKAIAPMPTERYESPAALADDLRRWLDGRPVSAHRGTVAYRMRKFLRRNWSTSGAVLLLVLVTAYYLVEVSAKNQRISAERDQARIVAGFLQDLFRGADPREAGAPDLPARVILDRGVGRLESDRDIEAGTRGLLEATIAKSYQSLGIYESARRMYQRALPALVGADGEAALLHARVLKDSAANELDAGDAAMASENLAAALALLEPPARPPDMRAAYAEAVAAMSLSSLSRPAEAQVHYERIAAMRPALFDKDRRFFAEMLLLRADNEQIQLHPQRAEERAREAVEVYRATFGERDADHALATALLADTLTDLHRYEEAETRYLAAIGGLRAVLGARHREVGIKLSNLGLMYLRLGRFDEARTSLDEALDIMATVFGPDHYYVSSPLIYLAWLDVEQGHAGDARAVLARARRIVEAAGSETFLARVQHVQARIDCASNDVAAALASFEQAERVYAAHADPFRGPALRLHRAQCLVAHGRADEVRDTLAPIIDALEQGLGAQAWDTRQAILLAGTLGAAAPRPR